MAKKFCLRKNSMNKRIGTKDFLVLSTLTKGYKKGAPPMSHLAVCKRVHCAVFLYRKNYTVMFLNWTMHLFLCFCLHTTLWHHSWPLKTDIFNVRPYCSYEHKQQINRKVCGPSVTGWQNNRKSTLDKTPGAFLHRSISVITQQGGREKKRKGLEDNTIYYAGG